MTQAIACAATPLKSEMIKTNCRRRFIIRIESLKTSAILPFDNLIYQAEAIYEADKVILREYGIAVVLLRVFMERIIFPYRIESSVTNQRVKMKRFYQLKERDMESQKDPVCGMQVNEQEAAGQSDYKGQTYLFCSQGCKTQFDQNPEQFVGQSAVG